MKKKVTPKKMLKDILFMLPQVERALKKEEKYSTLIKYLKSGNYIEDDSKDFPTMKQISEGTNLKLIKINKQLEEIYMKIFDYNQGFVFDFDRTELEFHVSGLDSCIIFKSNPLNQLPRVGDNISMRCR